MTEAIAREITYFTRAEVDESYSGRGMYGKTTFGLIVESLNDIVAPIIEIFHEDEEIEIDTHDSREVMDFIRENGFRIDNMGLRYIVY